MVSRGCGSNAKRASKSRLTHDTHRSWGSTVNNLPDELKLVGTLVRVPLPDVGVELNEDARRRYRSVEMRLGYVAPDLLARDVSNPTERSELALKRVCRFLLTSGRCIWSFLD